MLLAVSKPVLKVVVLKTDGIIVNPPAGRPVRSEPSPICLPKNEPDEMVEKNPKLVDVVAAEIFPAVRVPVLIAKVLMAVA